MPDKGRSATPGRWAHAPTCRWYEQAEDGTESCDCGAADDAGRSSSTPAEIIAAAWVRHSMEARNEPNDHDVANAGAALTALREAGYSLWRQITREAGVPVSLPLAPDLGAMP